MSININVDNSWQTPLVGINATTNVSGITEPSNTRGNGSQPTETQTPAAAQRTQPHTAQTTQQTSSQNHTVEEEEENHLLFSCQCDSAGAIGTLLACLRRVLSKSGGTGNSIPTQFTSTQATGYGGASKLQHATVYAGPNGLTFHCVQGLAKQSQCSVDLPKGLFREYFVGEEEVWMESDDEDSTDGNNGEGGSQKSMRAKETIQGGEFGVNLTTVLECFSVLSKNHKPKASNAGGSAKVGGEFASLNNVPLCMSYDRDSATFHLEFLDENAGAGGCLVTCEVPGVAVDENGDQSGLASAFRSNSLLGRAILYSDALSAAVAELHDVPGASVVEVKLSETGIELGAVGPRSEVWVTVPYNSRQGTAGMYVGLECYLEEQDMSRKYPLSAFLTGMRGLEIGCETCISVNSRGMMAIQHQVSREDDGNAVRPSFVDFIMTCIEDEIEEEQDANENVEVDARNGMRDVTNDASVQDEASVRVKSVSSRHSRRKRQPQREHYESESSHDEHNAEVSFRDDEDTEEAINDATETNTRSTATSRILGELEVDNDMMSSNLGGTNKRRLSALADIRRRREQRQSMNKTAESDDESEDQSESALDSKHSGKKRRSSASRNESDSKQSDDEYNRAPRRQKAYIDTPQDPSQSDSESSDSEPENSQDVTADIPELFSKTSSMRTSRHGSRKFSEDEASEEPRMMYGDTKLEFTQDAYSSDESM